MQKDIGQLTIQNDVHKRQVEVLYSIDRTAKKKTSTSVTHEVICLDFGKNLSVPNITTNYVLLNILYAAESLIHIYPETLGKMRSDEVCPMYK